MSSEGRQVTLDHQKRQLAIRAALGRELTSLWRTKFNPDEIASSAELFAGDAIPVLEHFKRRSAEEGAEYFKTYREVAGPGPRRARPQSDVDGRRVKHSLGYAARIVPLKAIRNGSTPQQAASAGLQHSLGTAGRLAKEGSWDTLMNAMEEDMFSRGWQRVTGADPCDFCAMLSARGGTYSKATVAFEAHNWCQCEAEPVYSRERWLSPEQQELKELYDRYAKGKRHPLRAFRAERAAQSRAS